MTSISATDDADLDPDLHDGEATQDAIVTAVRKMGKQAEEGGLRRVYFYFSGHGVQDLDGPLEPVILPADFTEDLRYKSIALLAIAKFLQLTGIPEQFVVSDACRDFPFADTMLLQPHRDLFGVDIDRLPAGQESPFQLLRRASTRTPAG